MFSVGVCYQVHVEMFSVGVCYQVHAWGHRIVFPFIGHFTGEQKLELLLTHLPKSKNIILSSIPFSLASITEASMQIVRPSW